MRLVAFLLVLAALAIPASAAAYIAPPSLNIPGSDGGTLDDGPFPEWPYDNYVPLPLPTPEPSIDDFWGNVDPEDFWWPTPHPGWPW